MTAEQVVDKIRKLLALAASPNEAEAKSAYEMAQRLIAQYSVDLSQENKVEDIVEVEYKVKLPKVPSTFSEELPLIALAIAKPFGVYILIGRTGIKLVGFRTNISVAEHALDCILNQAFVDYRIGYRKNRSISFGISFWQGFRDAVMERFKEASNQETGMIVYDKVREHMGKYPTSGPLQKTGTDALAGKQSGMESGNNVQIRPGVSSANGGKFLN